MKLQCMKCRWEQEVASPEQVCACPHCKSARGLYLVRGTPVCRVCGRRTVCTSGSILGATWDCPRGHYREILSKYGKRYYFARGRKVVIDDSAAAALGAALTALKNLDADRQGG